jgi:hypothetical protein
VSTTITPWSIGTAMTSRGSAGTGHPAGCTCSACQGLTSLVRPRFFAGQVLTEVDLMELERYAMTAHRMHNRFLHGPGVVCGLDLLCEACGDGVVVNPGYALDPCGRDLVVPTSQQVDVAKLIAACVAAERTQPVCDPPTTAPPSGCDTDQHWCITLEYREQPVRPVTPLATSRTSSSSCSCGCNGKSNGNGNGCGCGGSPTPTAGWSCTCGQGGSRSTLACGCSSYVAATDLPPGCEPTRIVECFDIGVCRCDGACCTLGSVLEGTLIAQLATCFKSVWPVVGKRMTKGQQKSTLLAMLGQNSNLEQTRGGVCALYDGVLDLYMRDPLRTLCQLPVELQQVNCDPQGDSEEESVYFNRLVNGSQVLLMLVIAYVRDCVCHALNPPCPDPCDDRVILGCVTVRDGKVIEICNLECRRYAGSFVSRRYWLPIGPVILWGLGLLCCFPLLGRSRSVARVLQTVDPTGRMAGLLSSNDFAVVGGWKDRAREAFVKVKPSAIRDKLTPPEEMVNLAALHGSQAGDAQETLQNANMKVDTVDVTSPDAVPISTLGVLGVAKPGTAVRQYVYKGRVVGFGPAAPSQNPVV